MMMMSRQLHEMMQPSLIVKRSVVIHGHKTSVSMEPQFWEEFKKEGTLRHLTLAAMVDQIDQARTHGNLSSAIRVHILERALKRAVHLAALLPVPEPALAPVRVVR